MRRSGRRRLVAPLAVAVAVSLGAAGCTGGDRPPPRTNERRFTVPTGPASPGTPGAPGTGGSTRLGAVAGAHPFGLKWNWTQDATLDYAARTGGGMTFFETEWCEIEPEQGRRTWDPVDSIVARSGRLGHDLLLKIRVGSCWASDGDGVLSFDPNENTRKSRSHMPRDLAAYEEFVRAFVTRYAAQGVHHYALENEVDAANFWAGSFEDYARLVRSGAEAVRASDPEAVVLDAGISSTGYGVALAADLLARGEEERALAYYQAYYQRRQEGGASRFPRVGSVDELRGVVGSDMGRRAQEALQETFALARDGVIDAYQLHYYESYRQLGELLDWLRASIPADLPIEAWEVGVAWPGDGYDEQVQATETAYLLASLLARDVRRAVYLPLAYTPGRGREAVFRGLLTPEGEELPAAPVYRTLVAAAAGATAAAPVQAQGLSGVVLDHGDRSVAVVWAGQSGQAGQPGQPGQPGQAGQSARLAGPPATGTSVTDASGIAVDWPQGGLDVGPDPLVITRDTSAADTQALLGQVEAG